MLRTLTHRAPALLSNPTTPHLHLRTLTTLPSNPHIYIFPHPTQPTSNLLTLLPTSPPSTQLAIGSTTSNPPTPNSITTNPAFLSLLHRTLATHAHADPILISAAAALATSNSAFQTGGGVPLSRTARRQITGSAGASDQGGAGGGGRGGWIHVYDMRHPPDFGRIPDPEDIFGSLEVEADGSFTDGNGRYQESGTYRICTRDGVLQLSEFLRERVVEALKAEEGKESGS